MADCAFNGAGQELFSERLPEEERLKSLVTDADEVWCWPAAWFARHGRGSVACGSTGWQFTACDQLRRGRGLGLAGRRVGLRAVSRRAALVSCWTGGFAWNALAKWRLRWMRRSRAAGLEQRGRVPPAGTADGRLLRRERSGTLAWSKAIPVTEPPPLTQPPPRSSGLPIFQGAAFRGVNMHMSATFGSSKTDARLSWWIRVACRAFR
jgi:hypothetical protein